MRLLIALLLVLATVVPAQAQAGPRQDCEGATLQGSPTAHSDGRFTPVLLVHGWRGQPDMWSKPIDGSTLTQQPAGNRNLAGNLQELPGAAVYTVDYSKVAERWFTDSDAGGEAFLKAATCIARDKAFHGHKMIVVAHSMGGLITRWAANTNEEIRNDLGLVITLGTPYEGSWLAAVLVTLFDGAVKVASKDKRVALLRGLFHLFLTHCKKNGSDPDCTGLNYLRRAFESSTNFMTGSPVLGDLKDWPSGVRVATLSGETMIENVVTRLFSALTGKSGVSVGDGVVGVDSATRGNHPEKVATCRHEYNLLQLTTVELVKLFQAIFADCHHFNEARLIQLTNEVTGRVNDYLAETGGTRIVNMDLLDRSGNLASGYRVIESGGQVTVCSGSLASVGVDIVQCAPHAASADVCWVQSDRRSLVCAINPWDKTVIRTTVDIPLPPTPKPPQARPWAVELDGGLQCRVRNGGAWAGRSDNYTGVYWCGVGKEVVLVDAYSRTPDYFDKSSPTWTALVGQIGDDNTRYPPPRKVAVKVAYYATN